MHQSYLVLSLFYLLCRSHRVHQPVQGFDYAKQHLGRLGGDEETLPVSQDTLVMSLQIKDTPLSLEKALQQDGTANKKSLTSDKFKRYTCEKSQGGTGDIFCSNRVKEKKRNFLHILIVSFNFHFSILARLTTTTTFIPSVQIEVWQLHQYFTVFALNNKVEKVSAARFEQQPHSHSSYSSIRNI